MSLSLEALEQRVAALEREVDLLRQALPWPPATETPAERGVRMRHEAAQDQAAVAALWADVLRQMGISGQPIGVQALREMMLKEGVNPNENTFSQGIIDMREE